MKKYRLNIDGKEVFGLPGQTILEVCRENDIFIPTLCYDERTEIYGSCGLCMVEIEGNPKLWKACATEIVDGWVIKTNTKRVKESRKTNLELLLSNHRGDCRPPCAKACPAGTDCQGYVGLIANGEFEEAIRLIKERIPLPASIGRVCPHPCETACRRGLVEEPISIAWLKRFAADMDLCSEEAFMPDIAPDTGKSVAIIGGGPYGLSMAYFLRQKGHDVTIYEAMPKLGGMLRYGIPEYRLPKEVLDEEIDLIGQMGVTMVPNTKIGTDISFEAIRRDYDAVCIGIGAWRSTGVRCKGEDADGVIGGIDFLRKIVRNEEINLGENVAIVGGGNTAMDACRSAVRLGAKKVYNIYRRTKDEMPADMVEIEEAEEEGVIFLNLTNPLEIVTDEAGHACRMVLQVMELGEPDESGRRRPVPVEGETKTIDVDTVILAIGQAVDAAGIDGVELTRKNGIVYDADTFMTQIPGVFAGGDCGNDKISIAVESIADAQKASGIVDAYLKGEHVSYRPEYHVVRTDITEKTFEDRERMCRPVMPQLTAEERKDNFTEVVYGYDIEQAMTDASRCLECGCGDYFECKLIRYANQYDVNPDRLSGDINLVEDYHDEHPFIIRDPNKCILCGLCVRVCDQVMGIGALGLVNRGFDTVVKPALEQPLLESGCISCGQCVSVCPTGALQEKLPIDKSVPLQTEVTDTTCAYCSVGCSLHAESCGNMLIKAVPDKKGIVNQGLLCGRGKFGFVCEPEGEKIADPMIKNALGTMQSADYYDALMTVVKKTESIAAKYGKNAVAVSVSDRMTNEEAYVMKKFADAIGARTLCLNNVESGLQKVLGVDGSPNTIDELMMTNVILVAGYNEKENPIIRVKLKDAAANGAKVVLINPAEYKQEHFAFAYDVIYTENDLSFLMGMAKALSDMGKAKDVSGSEIFAESVKDTPVDEKAAAIAKLYADASKAMIVFQKNFVSAECAKLLADIALLSGHIGSPRDGILQLVSKNNSQGLIQLGISDGVKSLDGVKALIDFGEDADSSCFEDLEFLAVIDTHMTETAKRADVVIPGTGFVSACGTYMNTERRIQQARPVTLEEAMFSNWEIAAEMAHLYEVEFGFEEVCDIVADMNGTIGWYRDVSVGEVCKGVLSCSGAALVPAEQAVFAKEKATTDYLMEETDRQMPGF